MLFRIWEHRILDKLASATGQIPGISPQRLVSASVGVSGKSNVLAAAQKSHEKSNFTEEHSYFVYEQYLPYVSFMVISGISMGKQVVASFEVQLFATEDVAVTSPIGCTPRHAYSGLQYCTVRCFVSIALALTYSAGVVREVVSPSAL